MRMTFVRRQPAAVSRSLRGEQCRRRVAMVEKSAWASCVADHVRQNTGQIAYLSMAYSHARCTKNLELAAIAIHNLFGQRCELHEVPLRRKKGRKFHWQQNCLTLLRFTLSNFVYVSLLW